MPYDSIIVRRVCWIDIRKRGKTMSNIPKKVIERFMKTVPKFQKILQIAKDRDVNEADTVSVLNDIFGEIFGYNKYVEVTSEFAIRGTYCDLAIKVEDKVQFLIEVKAIGIELKDAHMRQAIDYGANHGVPWIILTNGIEWRVFRLRFEQPINIDSVCTFDFLLLNPRDEKDQECLFMLAKEGLIRKARDDYYEKVQSVNRYVIGNLILAEPVLSILRRELKKLSNGIRIDITEIEELVRSEVLKREILEGEQAEVAQARVTKFYRKGIGTKRRKTKELKELSKVTTKSATDRSLGKVEGENKVTEPDS
jgi:predicted type IV restriction endonuclease